jgi:hypothetical protein
MFLEDVSVFCHCWVEIEKLGGVESAWDWDKRDSGIWDLAWRSTSFTSSECECESLYITLHEGEGEEELSQASTLPASRSIPLQP